MAFEQRAIDVLAGLVPFLHPSLEHAVRHSWPKIFKFPGKLNGIFGVIFQPEKKWVDYTCVAKAARVISCLRLEGALFRFESSDCMLGVHKDRRLT